MPLFQNLNKTPQHNIYYNPLFADYDNNNNTYNENSLEYIFSEIKTICNKPNVTDNELSNIKKIIDTSEPFQRFLYLIDKPNKLAKLETTPPPTIDIIQPVPDEDVKIDITI
jgi:hypothetical protein